jgi:hypothetical protein
MELFGSQCTYFHEIWYFRILLKSVEKIQVSLQLDKNNSYYTWRPIYLFNHILLNFS